MGRGGCDGARGLANGCQGRQGARRGCMKFDAIIISPGLFPVSPSPSPTKPAQAKHQGSFTSQFTPYPFTAFPSQTRSSLIPALSCGIEPIHSHLHSYSHSDPIHFPSVRPSVRDPLSLLHEHIWRGPIISASLDLDETQRKSPKSPHLASSAGLGPAELRHSFVTAEL